MNIQEHAYQLTAYEKGGFIDIKDYMKDLIKSQIAEVDFETLLMAYNEYCIENLYEEFLDNDEEIFQMYFKNMTDIIRATQYGEYNFLDAYVRFNGYGNLDSYDSIEVEEEIKADHNFIEYMIIWKEDYDFLEMEELFENEDEILKLAYKLVKLGY